MLEDTSTTAKGAAGAAGAAGGASVAGASVGRASAGAASAVVAGGASARGASVGGASVAGASVGGASAGGAAVGAVSGLAGLVELEEGLRFQVGVLEVEVLAPRDAARLLARFAAIAKLAEGAVTLLAARAAETGEWRARGALSAAHDLAQRTGTTVTQARETLEASEVLARLDATRAAVRQGRLSAAQTAVVADAAAADPAAEERLLARAATATLAGLRDERDRVKAAAVPGDGEARHRHLVRTRALRLGTAPDGAGTGSWRLPPDTHAEVKAALEPFVRAAFHRARQAGRHEPGDAYAADALVDLARTTLHPPAPTRAPSPTAGVGAEQPTALPALAAAVPALPDGQPTPTSAGAALADSRPTPTTALGPPPSAPAPPTAPAGRARRAAAKVIVRVDHAALLRGHTQAGETCEIAGIGPVPVAVVTDWIATGDTFLAAIVTRGVDVATVAHLGRRPNAAQLTALHWRDPTCRIESCNRPVREWDHHHDYAHTRHTLLTETGGLCHHHHDLKTYNHHRLAPSAIPGKLRLLPPDSPDPPPRE